MLSNRSEDSIHGRPKDRLLGLIDKYLKEEQKPSYIAKVLRLSANKNALANDKATRLEKLYMLSAKQLMSIIDRVSIKPAKVAMSKAEITSADGVQRIRLDNGPRFSGCLGKKSGKYMSGGFGNVSSASSEGRSDDEPDLAVKVMHSGEKRDLKTAQHEARYNRMMGRQCFLFEFSGRPGLVMDWQEGEPLNKLIDQDELKNYSFDQRLRWLISLLKDLNKMHSNFFVHFDIQTKNVVVDVNKQSMTLIDFGISHREKLKNGSYEISMSDDLSCLATDILIPLFKLEITASQSLLGQAIYALNCALRSYVVEEQCTSLQALNYCELLLKEYTNLSVDKLDDIKAQTIDRKELQAEDVLRGSERAHKI